MDQEPTLVNINKIIKNKQTNIVQSYEDTENLDGN